MAVVYDIAKGSVTCHDHEQQAFIPTVEHYSNS